MTHNESTAIIFGHSHLFFPLAKPLFSSSFSHCLWAAISACGTNHSDCLVPNMADDMCFSDITNQRRKGRRHLTLRLYTFAELGNNYSDTVPSHKETRAPVRDMSAIMPVLPKTAPCSSIFCHQIITQPYVDPVKNAVLTPLGNIHVETYAYALFK